MPLNNKMMRDIGRDAWLLAGIAFVVYTAACARTSNSAWAFKLSAVMVTFLTPLLNRLNHGSALESQSAGVQAALCAGAGAMAKALPDHTLVKLAEQHFPMPADTLAANCLTNFFLLGLLGGIFGHAMAARSTPQKKSYLLNYYAAAQMLTWLLTEASAQYFPKEMLYSVIMSPTVWAPIVLSEALLPVPENVVSLSVFILGIAACISLPICMKRMDMLSPDFFPCLRINGNFAVACSALTGLMIATLGNVMNSASERVAAMTAPPHTGPRGRRD